MKTAIATGATRGIGRAIALKLLEIIKEAVSHFGGIDVLDNNAGMFHSGALLETEIENWNKVHAVNARAPFFLCKAAIPFLKKSGLAFE